MKIIHAADLHIGTPFSRFDREIARKRNIELSNTFKTMVEQAKCLGVKLIILSGDVFDSDRPFKKDKEFFYSIIASTPEIDFLYLRGNHDLKESFERHDINNLKIFGSEWIKYSYGNIAVYGIEISPKNERSLYSALHTEFSEFNIVMMHGQVTNNGEAGKNYIILQKLRNKNIDYLALGHLHSFRKEKLDSRGVWAYSGCIEGRGFDETGDKGYILLDTDKNTAEFIPCAKRHIIEQKIDISSAVNINSVIDSIKSQIKASPEDMISIIVIGRVLFDTKELSQRLEELLKRKYFYFRAKNETLKSYKPEDFINDKSLKGEFVRKVLSSDMFDDDKSKVISLGLKAIDGEDIE